MDLREQARAAGIELEYTDTWGRVHAASDEALTSVLQVLPRAAETGPFDPTIVVTEGQTSLRVRIPQEKPDATVKLEFNWEDGSKEHRWFWLPELPQADGVATFPLPRALPLGYHLIRLYRLEGADHFPLGDAHFIVAPKRAMECTERLSGLAVSLFGLRSDRNWGCGDCTDLKLLAQMAASHGAHFVALNPLHAIANRQPYNTSPYLPQSSLWRNFLYIDPTQADGYQPDTKWDNACAALRATQFVEYERVAALKLEVLYQAFQRCSTDYQISDSLRSYATYCALDEEMHRRDPKVWLWTDWPEEYRDPRSEAVARFAQAYDQRIRFHAYLQLQLDRQLADAHRAALSAGMKIGLYHDLALATDRFGADLWSAREFYVDGCRVGAPPDELGPGGQDWGFPPPNREQHRRDGYRRFAETIRASARHGGALRIDHVMRFFRLYWIPEGLTAKEGVYVRDYADDLLGVLRLESVRNGFVVIGEDLGTVEEEVRDVLRDSGILGIRVLWFEKDPDGSYRSPDRYPELAAVSATTHDLATVAGFFEATDVQARLDSGLIPVEAFHQQLTARGIDVDHLRLALEKAGYEEDPVGFVLSTPSLLAVVNQEDITGEVQQQNLPASTWQQPNWRRKMRVPMEQLDGWLAKVNWRRDQPSKSA